MTSLTRRVSGLAKVDIVRVSFYDAFDALPRACPRATRIVDGGEKATREKQRPKSNHRNSGAPCYACVEQFDTHYSVDFGAETSAGKDAGSLTCAFERTCIAEMKSLGLTISLRVVRSEPERADVMLYGTEPGCCLFAGAADSIKVDPRKPLTRMSFYKGVKARGALLIENERVGTLYLRFSR